MNNLNMLLLGNPLLREKSTPVDVIDDSVLDILDEMARMMDDQNGVGLAAPQVGILKRMLVFREVKGRRDAGITHKVINPKIISTSNESIVISEGCLSVLGIDGPVFADVARPESVVVEWTNENGKLVRKEFDGFPSRVIQHEIDHLDGVLFIDLLSSAKREMVVRKVKKRGATT